ncbi:MAG: intermembrane transport protein PqiB [Gammaproteobacteria bacterium]
MAGSEHEAAPETLPAAEARGARGLSLFWLVPLVAALVAGWLGWQAWSARGPEITIVFAHAEGLEPGRTAIRFKAVEVGKVGEVRIAPDLASVEVHARIARDFAPHLTTGTRFWAVRPRIGASGVSGLGTLVSGVYIEVDPAPGEAATRFTALDAPPIVTSDAPGRAFVLRAARLYNLQPGTPITFKDIEVGEVLGYELADDGERIAVHVFVREPHAALVHENSRFWVASGLDLSIGSDGIDVRTSSLQEMVLGGIRFDTPPGEDAPAAAAGHPFELHESFAAVAESGYTEQVRYVLYFDESVRGLAPGAPVEFRGIKLGEVTEVGLEYSRQGLNPAIPVVVTLHARRLGDGPGDIEDAAAMVTDLIAKGLRARLQTGNLLTGQLYVEFALLPDAPARYVTGRRHLPQIPTLPTEFGEFKNNVNGLLAELRAFPLSTVGERAVGALTAIERLVDDPATAGVLRAAGSSFTAVEDAARAFEASIGPLREDLRGALAGLGEGSPLYVRMHETLRQLEAMARAVRELGDTLEREPQSVIWGKEPGDEGE